MTTQDRRIEILLHLRDQVSAGLEKVGGRFQTLRQQLRRASLTLTGMTAAVGGAVLLAANAGRDYGQALAQLQGAVERAGGDFGTLEKRIQEQTRSLTRLTDFTATDGVKALTTLVDMTGNVEEAFELLGLTLDVASQRHVDVAVAAKNVRNAVNEGSGELVENYLPALKETTERSERLRLVMERFGGSAENNADTVA